MEPEWEKFLSLMTDDGDNTSSPLFQLIMDHFPIPFVTKLTDTILRGPTYELKHQAIGLLVHVFDETLTENYLSVDRSYIEELENSVMSMLMEEDSYVQDKAKGLAKTLLVLSIHHERVWSDFVDIAGKSLIADQSDQLKKNIVDIFVDLDSDYQENICRQLGPMIMNVHFKKIVEMFDESEEDVRPFNILLGVCDMVSVDQVTLLMEAATKAPLFWGKKVSPWKKCFAGFAMCYCIRNTNLNFSTQMLDKIKNIVSLMLQSKDEDLSNTAVKLSASLLHSCFRLI
ncbi:hypothetical protein ACP275_09G026600 [Erythranthe tilingii]